MNSFTLSLAYLRHRWLSTLLSLLTLASGGGLIVALLLMNAQLQNQFSKNLQGIDLVVGAKGSPLQLILSAVFEMDIPTGNIPLDEAEKLVHHPLVKGTIPLALGDNYNGFHIVGAPRTYAEHYHARLAQGHFYTRQMQAVLGADVAVKFRLKPGDKIIGAHGLVNSDDLHSDFPYTVVGILAPTGTVLDRVVLTPISSVWHVHEHPDADDAEDVAHKNAHPEKEITALLIAYRTPLAAASLPREINQSTVMQAASPAFEVARLMHFMGAGAEAMQAVGLFLMLLAGFGMFAALYNGMNERRYDLALMRSLGAPPRRLFSLVMCESLTLAFFGALCGLALGHGLVALGGAYLAGAQHMRLSGALFLPEELWLVAGSMAIGVIAALLPAMNVYRIDVFKTLAR